METKICTECGVEKELSEYYKQRRGKNYAHRAKCKICMLEEHRIYVKENKDKMYIYHKEYRKENKGKLIENRKKYYIKNKEKIIEQTSKYFKNNRQKMYEYKNKYRKENKEKYNERAKKYRKENNEKIKKYNRQWYQKDKGRYSGKQRDRVINLTHGYIITVLRQKGISRENITPELIEFERAIITAKRELKKHKQLNA